MVYGHALVLEGSSFALAADGVQTGVCQTASCSNSSRRVSTSPFENASKPLRTRFSLGWAMAVGAAAQPVAVQPIPDPPLIDARLVGWHGKADPHIVATSP